MEIVVLPTRAALAREAAARFVAITQDAIRARGWFAVALAGGSTPREMYELLAAPEFAAQVDWARVQVFWGDERTVPPDHPDSNFKTANDALLSRVPIPLQNVHRIRAELPAEDAAREYEETLSTFFKNDIGRGQTRTNTDKDFSRRSSVFVSVPSFDLILLGLGADGHTASLFPHSPALSEATRWVAAQYVEKLGADRITLTVPIINAARNILFLVAGADKASAARDVLRGEHRPGALPAQLIKPGDGKLVWLLDEDAGRELAIGK